MVGLVTLVTIRVGSVTSTCLWSSFGDMRTYSAPMLPGSSGALPGQRSTTRGLRSEAGESDAFFGSPGIAGQVAHKPRSRDREDGMRYIVEPLVNDSLVLSRPKDRQGRTSCHRTWAVRQTWRRVSSLVG